MNDRRMSPEQDERLSAYLAGELADDEATALEEELAGDVELRSELDALAAALVSLSGADDVAVPDGFAERLDARLAAEATVPDLAQRRRERAKRTNRWMAIGTAAAVVVLGAVMGGNALRTMTSGGGATSADRADEMSAELDDAATPSGPVIVTDDLRVAGQSQLRRRFSDLPEVQALLGTSVDQAVQVAAQYSAAVPEELRAQKSAPLREAPAAASGDGEESATVEDDVSVSSGASSAGGEGAAGATSPQSGSASRQALAPTLARCLATISEGATEPLVPARIETLRYDGRRAIAYVLVTAQPDSASLDRTEVWVVARSDCATLVFQQS